jgi:hypothetical protein
MGMIMGASELRATAVTPASRGAPRLRYLSFLSDIGMDKWQRERKISHLAVAPTYAIEPTMPTV